MEKSKLYQYKVSWDQYSFSNTDFGFKDSPVLLSSWNPVSGIAIWVQTLYSDQTLVKEHTEKKIKNRMEADSWTSIMHLRISWLSRILLYYYAVNKP